MRRLQLLMVAGLLLAAPLSLVLVTALPPETDGEQAGGSSSGTSWRPPNSTELQREANAWRLTRKQAQAIGEPHGAGKLRICISPYTPGVKCSYTQPGEASGYQVALFKSIAANVSWLNDTSSWYFSCLKTTAMLDGLVDNGTCMLAPCNIVASPSLMKRGIQPSIVVDKDGLLIMVKKTTDEGLLLWTPFMAFSWEVWLMLLLTGLVVGTCIVLNDVFAFRGMEESRRDKRRFDSMRASSYSTVSDSNSDSANSDGSDSTTDDVSDDDDEHHHSHSHRAAKESGGKAAVDSKDVSLKELEPRAPWYQRWFVLSDEEYATWRKMLRTNTRRSVLRVVGMADSPIAQTLPAQIVLFGFGMLLMFIVMLFTASAAAIFTKARLVTSVRSLEDLRGQAVGTWAPYTSKLKDLGVAATPLPWDDEQDEEAMLRKLADGSLAAIVIDSAFVKHTVSQHCEFVAVGTPFAVADYGYGYNARLSRNLTSDMNKHIREAVMDGEAERLFNQHLKAGDCPDEVKEAKAAAIKLRHVGGLWLALAICMLAGTLLLLVKYIIRRPLLKLKGVASRAALERAQAARMRGSPGGKTKSKFVLKGGLKRKPKSGDSGHHNDS